MDIPKMEILELSQEELDEHDRVFGGLSDATRDLADAQLRTLVDPDEAESVTTEIRELTRRLSVALRPGGIGTSRGPDGQGRADGNPVMGVRNPFAPLRKDGRTVHGPGHITYSLDLTALYEGWPGHVFGGTAAMLIDQLVGDVAASADGAGMTASLTLTYLRPLPLGHLDVEGRMQAKEGRKTTVVAEIRDADGQVCVRGEALMIVPRWAAQNTDWSPDQRLE